MIAIQIILIAGFLVVLYRVLADPNSYQFRAWTKILAILFVIAAILAVLFPNTTNTIAHWAGVSRGADLLLYLLTVAFILSIFSIYTQEKRQQKRMVILARKLAILEANLRASKPRK